MDLSKLSTRDLEALRDGNLSAVSTEGLEMLRQGAAPVPAQQPPSKLEMLKNEAVTSVPGRALRGVRDTVDAGAQLLTRGWASAARGLDAVGVPGMGAASRFLDEEAGQVQRINDLGEQEYQQARQASIDGGEGIDIARIAGSSALPGALFSKVAPAATLAGKAWQGAKIGAATSLFQPVFGEQANDFWATKAKQAGVGAALGAVTAPAADKVGGWLADRVNALVGRGKAAAQNVMGQLPTKQAIEQRVSEDLRRQGIDFYRDLTESARKQMLEKAQQALRSGGELDLAALSRKADFEALQVQPTLGQLTRKPEQFSWEMNKRAAVPELATRFGEQNQRLVQIMDEMRAQAGPKVDAYSAGQSVSGALKKYDEGLSKEVSEAYGAFRASTGARADVPMAPIARTAGEVIDTFGKENVPPAVLSKLKGFGVFGGKQTKVFDVLEADKLLKVINANYDPMNRPQAAALDALRRGLKEAIDQTPVPEAGPSAELLKTALKKASERFQLLDDVPALKASSLDDVTPEKFVQQYLQRGSVDEAKKLVGLLGPEERGVLRGQVLDVVRSKALTRADSSEFAKFSQSGYRDALQEIGDRKLQLLFSPDEIAQMKRLARVSSSIQVQPAGAWVNNSNTAVEGLGLIANIAGSKSPLIGMATAIPGAISTGSRATASLNAAMNPISPTQYVNPQLAARFGGLLAPAFTVAPIAATQGGGNENNKYRR